MRKLAVSILVALFCIPLFAGSIRYAYGNNISSDDFESLPLVGSIYTDDSDNVLAVRFVRDNIVAFDMLMTKGPYHIGSELSPRAAVTSVGLYGTPGFAYGSYSRTTALYPLSPLAVLGVKYRNGVSALALAGVKVHVCLADLWDASSTLIQNGKVVSWCAVGASLASSIDFACTYGVTFSHNIGTFRWEAGIADLEVLGQPGIFSFCLGMGVDI